MLSAGDQGVTTASTATNSIVLNALSVSWTATGSSGFFVKPVGSGTGTAKLDWNSASGEIFVASSSCRYKKNIETVQPAEAARVWDLRPVSFHGIKADESDRKLYGFIAEEVEEIDPRLVYYHPDEDGKPRVEGVNYDMVSKLAWVAACATFCIR